MKPHTARYTRASPRLKIAGLDSFQQSLGFDWNLRRALRVVRDRWQRLKREQNRRYYEAVLRIRGRIERGLKCTTAKLVELEKQLRERHEQLPGLKKAAILFGGRMSLQGIAQVMDITTAELARRRTLARLHRTALEELTMRQLEHEVSREQPWLTKPRSGKAEAKMQRIADFCKQVHPLVGKNIASNGGGWISIRADKEWLATLSQEAQ